ncbi:hypothetical protein HMPREF0762_00877 [Slackia exigua ATCC 700122]|uniref:Uncharacterized protein n=1 Tax=Slackia exigua (strain ATCC 700122 / DSM 15923 / CIP 105133 / JCM 11022 / KCTC 5966 / S-7) TaxID=649764 RepID=D0WGC6_SLAES|nr:hypothetical protein HMPREF0762_00877 [Slackia exigua ATCC 700122]
MRPHVLDGACAEQPDPSARRCRRQGAWVRMGGAGRGILATRLLPVA